MSGAEQSSDNLVKTPAAGFINTFLKVSASPLHEQANTYGGNKFSPTVEVPCRCAFLVFKVYVDVFVTVAFLKPKCPPSNPSITVRAV